MIGRCYNCGTENILILFSAGHEHSKQTCPVCKCWWQVYPQRLATPDEIPEAPWPSTRAPTTWSA